MVAVAGRFDGKVFIPDGAIDLPRDQRVIIHFEPETGSSPTPSEEALPPGTRGSEMLKFAGMIDEEDLKLMTDAIEEGCEQVDPDAW